MQKGNKKEHQTKILECVGLWGSGKTTTVNALQGVMSDQGLAVVSYGTCQSYAQTIPKTKRWMRYIRHRQLIRFLYFVLRFYLRYGFAAVTSSHEVKRWFEPVKIVCDVSRYIQDHPGVDYVLGDEMLYSNLAIYACNYRLNREELLQLCQSVQHECPVTVVSFAVSPGVAAQRTGGRAYYANDLLPYADRLRLATTLQRSVAVTQEWLASQSKIGYTVREDQRGSKEVDKIFTQLTDA